MRIHANTLTRLQVCEAARIARVDFGRLTGHGSRKRDHAFDVTLTGESRRRPNSGAGGSGDEYAATWDQWGVFLAVLFHADDSVTTGPYADAEAFGRATFWRFDDRSAEVDYATEPVFWPVDAHGDHTFRWAGVPFQQSCTKCSARFTWER
jgi:hypothetical protein